MRKIGLTPAQKKEIREKLENVWNEWSDNLPENQKCSPAVCFEMEEIFKGIGAMFGLAGMGEE